MRVNGQWPNTEDLKTAGLVQPDGRVVALGNREGDKQSAGSLPRGTESCLNQRLAHSPAPLDPQGD